MKESDPQRRPGIAYNLVAGGSVERIAALSDGIFGVAMTLLLLDLRVPGREAIASEAALGHALAALAPQLLVYLMSFLTLGIFWVGQQTQLNHLVRASRGFTWLHLGFLFPVTIVPFSTRLLAEFVTYRTALLAYWANIVVLGLMLYLSWVHATRASLIRDDFPPAAQAAVCRRILAAQALYAVGAALCFVSPYASIACIVLVQLQFVFAPRFLGLARL